jgi:hypothetical protein
MRNDSLMLRDEVGVDPDYYVIDEPPALAAPAREPADYRVVREQLLEGLLDHAARPRLGLGLGCRRIVSVLRHAIQRGQPRLAPNAPSLH